MMIRINKYLSEAGYCSRREADRLIAAKRVLVNGSIPEIGTKVSKSDTVTVDGNIIQHDSKKIYLAFNKPVGIVSTTDQNIKNNIVDYINYPERLFHVGRLDKDSEGLILMTNDGDIVNKILRSTNHHEKEYIVKVDKSITKTFLNLMANGVHILDTKTKSCTLKKINAHTFSIILTEGLNRQIRRMCNVFDYKVVSLKRVRIMHIHCDIPTGKHRHLTQQEENTLFNLIKTSKE